jgi:hypothetical protein
MKTLVFVTVLLATAAVSSAERYDTPEGVVRGLLDARIDYIYACYEDTRDIETVLSCYHWESMYGNEDTDRSEWQSWAAMSDSARGEYKMSWLRGHDFFSQTSAMWPNDREYRVDVSLVDDEVFAAMATVPVSSGEITFYLLLMDGKYLIGKQSWLSEEG